MKGVINIGYGPTIPGELHVSSAPEMSGGGTQPPPKKAPVKKPGKKPKK